MQSKKPQSIYVPHNSQEVHIGTDTFLVSGGIKSLDPPCIGRANAFGEHPYTCHECHKQLRDLNNLIGKRKSAKLKTQECRLGSKGFRNDYANVKEQQEAQDKKEQELNQALKETVELKRMQVKQEHLLRYCEEGDRGRLITELMQLFHTNKDKENPIHLVLIRNLVSKLLRGNNHHYADLIIDISGLHRRVMGATKYVLTKNIFGLASETTCKRREQIVRINLGFNQAILESASPRFAGFPVVECHDEARTLRFLEPHKTDHGQIELIGKTWNPDVDTWPMQQSGSHY